MIDGESLQGVGKEARGETRLESYDRVKWSDIKLHRRSANGSVTDIYSTITLDNFEGHQLVSALEVTYDVGSTTDERNMLFNLTPSPNGTSYSLQGYRSIQNKRK